MHIGIIGITKSGKTTVFNALIRSTSAQSTGQQMNVGVAKVVDPRLDKLTAIFRPKREVYAEVRYTDIPGAPEGLGKSEGIGGEYLNALQRADALLHVVRAFNDPSVPHINTTVDPYRDAAAMDMELAFSDLAIIERRFKRLETDMRGAKPQERERAKKETALLERLRDGLAADVPIRRQEVSGEEHKTISNYQFLTAKPLLIVFNIGEDQLPEAAKIEAEAQERLAKPKVLATAMCGKLEAELGQMTPEDEGEFRATMGAGESAAARVIRASYELVGLIPFFTVGEDECRAWTIPLDTPAVKAAGQIHSDIERGFIRAEVVGYDDFVRCGSLPEARRQGVLRLEGKTYPVRDGDIINFLFNV
ncbi:MAG: redox-regulated ATPase YchF [Chloroflexi bacterium]|nr:redox-regulated ATPase YchF [Chloroflexota bacterium]